MGNIALKEVLENVRNVNSEKYIVKLQKNSDTNY